MSAMASGMRARETSTSSISRAVIIKKRLSIDNLVQFSLENCGMYYRQQILKMKECRVRDVGYCKSGKAVGIVSCIVQSTSRFLSILPFRYVAYDCLYSFIRAKFGTMLSVLYLHRVTRWPFQNDPFTVTIKKNVVDKAHLIARDLRSQEPWVWKGEQHYEASPIPFGGFTGLI